MPSPEQASLFDFGLDLRAMQEVKLRVMNATYAKNTMIAYRSAWKLFQAWCREAGRESLPATPQTCIDHAAWCIAQNLRLDTVHGRLKAVNHYHREHQQPLPFEASVHEFLRNARRALCEKPQGKEALTPVQLRKISTALGKSVLSVQDIEERSMILLCFALGWRCSELVSLDLRDIRWVEKGILVRLGKSKTISKAAADWWACITVAGRSLARFAH